MPTAITLNLKNLENLWLCENTFIRKGSRYFEHFPYMSLGDYEKNH